MKPKHSVRTVDRTFEIIEIVQKLDSAGVSEVSKWVNIDKSVVHNRLNMLVKKEYLSKKGDEYYVGLSSVDLGAYTRNRTEIYNAVQHEADKLAVKTGELTNFFIEQNGTGVYLYKRKVRMRSGSIRTREGYRSLLQNSVRFSNPISN